MYQSTSSIDLSEIKPTAWLARCIVTYASITRPERSRSRRIIEEPAEGGAGSRNLLSPEPRFFSLGALRQASPLSAPVSAAAVPAPTAASPSGSGPPYPPQPVGRKDPPSP